MYKVLLYYYYCKIEDPEKFKEQHHLFCIENNIRGRIIISKEGINGTISGLESDCILYMNELKSDSRFAGIDFKIDYHYEHVFKKLNVRIKDEIVNSGLKDIDLDLNSVEYINPKEFRSKKDDEDVVIIDLRSNYEHKQGKIKNAKTLDINNFREFPTKVKELEKYKNKTIITYCTGNIKCEKGSAYLKKMGFNKIFKLEGGIIKYGLETDGKDFEGQCYVFDSRISIPINKVNTTIINNCFVCKKESEKMVNCANSLCNLHVPICETCLIEYEGACSNECKNSSKKREYNSKGYYTRKQNGYNPYKGLKNKKIKQFTEHV